MKSLKLTLNVSAILFFAALEEKGFMLTGFNSTKVIIVIFLDVDEHHADTDGHLDDNDEHHADNDGYPDDDDDFPTDWYWPLSANTSRTSFSQVGFDGCHIFKPFVILINCYIFNEQNLS